MIDISLDTANWLGLSTSTRPVPASVVLHSKLFVHFFRVQVLGEVVMAGIVLMF